MATDTSHDPARFEPIAIVGQGCVLPGCLSTDDLWQTVLSQRSQIGIYDADGRTGHAGMIRGFEAHFQPAATRLDPSLVARLDPVLKWPLEASRQALADLEYQSLPASRAGVVLGNLSYPTRAHAHLAAEVWRHQLLGSLATPPRTAPHNRFMSGLPALLLARAWGFSNGSLALDAACASGLYAIKLACDRLQQGSADLMLAAAVNAADPLFLQAGFGALNALSQRGISQPLAADADGLVPAEGAVCLALRRLSDAQAAQEPILGIIRGIGLSNDGRSGGFLSPDITGQVRSMTQALHLANWQPEQVQAVECHATGTQVGDAVEIRSLQQVYTDQPLPLGSLKALLGHTITASGMAGVVKMLSAMQHATLPGLKITGQRNPALNNTAFEVPCDAMAWPSTPGPRRAAISSFGFGGNNAHLLLESPSATADASAAFHPPASRIAPMDLAVVGIGLRTHQDADADAFARRLIGGTPTPSTAGDGKLTLPPEALAFPPNELKRAAGQQLMLLDIVQQATARCPLGDPSRIGLFVGMQTDAYAARHLARLRWPTLLAEASFHPAPDWLQRSQQALAPLLNSDSVIGSMPNIVANRLSNQLNLQGPGITVSREELSGDAALEVARTALMRGEIDTALVAAVDLCREASHAYAMRQLLPGQARPPADAAVMLQVKPRTQAEKDGDHILGLIAGQPPAQPARYRLGNCQPDSPLTHTLGHAHAASGLLHLALGLLALHHRALPGSDGKPIPLLRDHESLRLAITNATFAGETTDWQLLPGPNDVATPVRPPDVKLVVFAANDRKGLAERLQANQPGGTGPVRLAIVAPADQHAQRREQAVAKLTGPHDPVFTAHRGDHYRETPIGGQLAFAFTGAAAAYPGMGQDLLVDFPWLADKIDHRLNDIQQALMPPPTSPLALGPFADLAGSSCLSQLHNELCLDSLALHPDAALGLSSGETNAMFSFGLWTDMDGLFDAIHASGLYSDALSGRYTAVRDHWQLPEDQPVDWVNWRVRVDSQQLRAAVEQHQGVYLTLIHSPQDSIIGGDASACQAVLDTLGQPPAVTVVHDLAIHCPVVAPFADTWRQLHDRPTQSVATPRFYSNYFGGPYTPTRQQIADALTGQALQTVDFPAIIEKAWQDGVRLFIELGPRDSLATAIRETLGQREYLVVSMDRNKVPAATQVRHAAAALWCAGVDIDLTTLLPPTGDHDTSAQPNGISFSLHPAPLPEELIQQPANQPPRRWQPPACQAGDPAGRVMPSPPPLAARFPAVAAEAHHPHAATPSSAATSSAAQPLLPASSAVAMARDSSLPEPAKAATSPADLILSGHRQMVQAHQDYLTTHQAALHAWHTTLSRLQTAVSGESLTSCVALPPVQAPTTAGSDSPGWPGPAFNREQLEALASGRISTILGDRFRFQDDFPLQVRMPEPPLLLCDRVLGIEGEALSMGPGRIWTQTDITHDSWYLHHGRMPAGIFIECGQADLLLISWLGVDAFNRGERAYRLLGCELVYHADLPKAGETLDYEIQIDGHAQQGNVRLFFFHYDGWVNGQRRISMRHGQAGFFTQAELDQAHGVLWTPEDADYTPSPRLDRAPQLTQHTQFSPQAVRAYTEGRLVACFGDTFALAATHTRSPRSAEGQYSLLAEVTRFIPQGGPAQRGYLRAETPVAPDDWFFAGHFHNDPCMPGTLMADACLQAMAFYLTACGWTLARDGWRFQPVTEVRYLFRCRGQVTPDSRQITYEVFVDEMGIIDGKPTLFAHVLVTVDGRKAFLCERFGLELVPDWPLSSQSRTLAQLAALDAEDHRPLARVDGNPIDRQALLHAAWGDPRRAFGPGFTHYLGPRRCPRLPGPPYHFVHRITQLDGAPQHHQPGATVTAVYDISPDAWYFSANTNAVMPTSVLMEVYLQPCGWLSTYSLDPESARQDLVYRNLDGQVHHRREVTPHHQCITTEVKLTSVSRAGGMIVHQFDLRCFLDDQLLLTGSTVFGFFPPDAMVNQKGFGARQDDLARLRQPADDAIELASRPRSLFDPTSSLRLPEDPLLMIERITGFWPQGGRQGLGAIRTERCIRADDWYFRAHFFQDPVQPGSLGIEAMLQSIQAMVLLSGIANELQQPHWEPLDLSNDLIWHYRGQVTPQNRRVQVEFEITHLQRQPGSIRVSGQARLWVDELPIYQAPQIGLRILEHAPPTAHDAPWESSWDIDLGRQQDAWLRDHCPTHTVPALPFTGMLDLMAQAAMQRWPDWPLPQIEQANALRWISLPEGRADGRVRLVPQHHNRVQATLLVRNDQGVFDVAARAQLAFSAPEPCGQMPSDLPALDDVTPVADPYADGSLFHGPALQLMRDLKRGSQGATAVLEMEALSMDPGVLHPAVLDAALHCLPHNNFNVWCPQISSDQAAFPAAIEQLWVSPELSTQRTLQVTAYWLGRHQGRPRCYLRLDAGQRLMGAFYLTEFLLPKGRLGNHSGIRRRRFLRDRQFVPGIALAHTGPEQSRLITTDIASSDLMPGTIQRAYRLPADLDAPAPLLAAKDHAGQWLRLHPGDVALNSRWECLNTPFNRFRIMLEETQDVVHASGQPEELDLDQVASAWAPWFHHQPHPLLALGLMLMKQFSRRVVLADPENFVRYRQRPALYLGNHQTGVESFLFLMLVIALTGMPAGAIAKREHQESWLGRIFQQADRVMGSLNPMFMLFFEREQQNGLLTLLKEFAHSLEHTPRSLMVHVDGTRSLTGGEPVKSVSSVLIDLALESHLPILPVRFAGGLSQVPQAHGLEFPLDYGQQDYFIGTAIPPESLLTLPYAQRSAYVRQCINQLGPQGQDDVTLPGDPVVREAINAHLGNAQHTSQVQAVIDVLMSRSRLADDIPKESLQALKRQLFHSP